MRSLFVTVLLAAAPALAAESLVWCIGAPDVSVQVIARDNADVYAFATQVIGKLPGVRKTTTSIVPIVKKDVYQWRIPGDAVE